MLFLKKDARQMHFSLTGSVLTKADSHDTSEPLASLSPGVAPVRRHVRLALPFLGLTNDDTRKADNVARMLEVGATMSGVRFSGRDSNWVPRLRRGSRSPGATGQSRLIPTSPGSWSKSGGVRPSKFGIPDRALAPREGLLTPASTSTLLH
jgi:hypothetical protein